MDFVSWYKKKIESNELDPPVNTWDNIQDQLDIDNSWKAIDNYLNARARLAIRYRISAAASLMVLIMAGAAWIYFASVNKDIRQEQIAAAVEPAERTDNIMKEPTGNLIQKKDVPSEIMVYNTKVIPEELNNSVTLATINGKELRDEELNDIGTMGYITERDGGALQKQAIEDIYLAGQTPGISVNKIIDPGRSYQNPAGKERRAFRKFYVGTRGQLANTWLVNQKTISGFKSASLVSTNATFGSNFGLYAGTNLLNRLDLQADLNILAQNNQDYNEYLNGQYVSSKLKLDYSQLALSLRYYINSYNFMEGEHGINFGAYLAYLHNAYQNIDDQTLYISDSYNNIDYGLMVGYEYIFPLYGHLGMGTGVRAYYGLNNIYSGDGYIPDYMNVTNNASVNITVSLKYLIK